MFDANGIVITYYELIDQVRNAKKGMSIDDAHAFLLELFEDTVEDMKIDEGEDMKIDEEDA